MKLRHVLAASSVWGHVECSVPCVAVRVYPPWMCDIVMCACVVRVSPSVTCDHRVSASQRVQVGKFAAHVEAIGTKTIQAVATSGPESQVSPIRLQPLHCLQVHGDRSSTAVWN